MISGASIRHQCAKDNFYGDTDTIENQLSILEGHWAALLRRMSAENRVPRPKSVDHVPLLSLVSLQMLRTDRHRSESNTHLNQLLQIVYSHQSDQIASSDGGLDWRVEDPVSGLRVFEPMAWLLDDLKMCLIRSDPSHAFLTSDNPVFKYNLYCEGVTYSGVTGAAKQGLQIFVPISPELILLMYDGGVYKVGKPGSNHPISATAQDSRMLNCLQYVGADSNLYFSSGFELSYFQQMAKDYRNARRTAGPQINEATEVGNPQNVLIHQYHRTPDLHLKLSFLSIRRRARRASKTDRLSAYRRQVPEVLQPPYHDMGPERRTFQTVTRSTSKLRDSKPVR